MVFSTLHERDYYFRPNTITLKTKSIYQKKKKKSLGQTLQAPKSYENGWVKLSGVG